MKKAKYLWMDLEMTGLDPRKDRIIEVAAIATDAKLNEIASLKSAVKVDSQIIKERMVGDFWDQNAKTRDELINQSQTGATVNEVENELVDFVKKYFGKEVYLAGNSIHQDRKFIENEMPQLNKLLHYRMLDVSAWKIYFEEALKKKFIKPENHRAFDDINGSIEELKWYLTFLK